MATDSRVGTTIAEYRIERLLGRGGMNQDVTTIDLHGPCLAGITVDPRARRVWVSRYDGPACVRLLETPSSPTPS